MSNLLTISHKEDYLLLTMFTGVTDTVGKRMCREMSLLYVMWQTGSCGHSLLVPSYAAHCRSQPNLWPFVLGHHRWADLITHG